MDIEEYSKYKQSYERKIPELLLEYLKKEKWNNYLDLGCGDGSLLNALNNEKYFDGKLVYAIDLSENRMNLVKKINKDFVCLVGDACDVKEIKNESIDFLVSEQVIEHVESDEAMVKEICRILKKGGTVYLSTVFKKWYGWYFYRCSGKWVLDPTHLREYSKDGQLTDIFEKYNFEILENKKTLVKRSFAEFMLKRAGIKNLKSFNIPIFGYYYWEIVCRKK